MIDLQNLMQALATQRSVYHSEADFQHAFAWEVNRRLPTASVRLERPIRASGKLLHLDFLVRSEKTSMAVELKYKTRKFRFDLEEEEYRLANHSAADQGRYDFIKDICRLEEITSNFNGCEGWAIMLTNDSTYWKPPNTKATMDNAFRIHEGRLLSGSLEWTSNASEGTKKNRSSALHMTGQYVLRWLDYSAPSTESYGQFRFLAVHVPKCVA